MSEEGKVVKFKFVVDEQSAQRVNRVLDEMIKRAQELAKTLQGVGGFGGGGMLGGGNVGGRSPSPQSTLAASASPHTQKVSFSSVLTQNVDAFKKMAQEGGSAMKVLGDAVGRGVDAQRREIFKLQQSMEGLLRVYGKFAGTKVGESIQDKVLMLQTRIAGHQKELGKLEGMRPPGQELMPEVPWPEQAKAGWFTRFRGFLNQGGGVGGTQLGLGSLSRIPGLGFLGAGAGGAILGGATAVAGLGIGAAKSQAGAAWNAPLISAQLRAESASDLAAYARKLRSGNYSDIRAMTEIQGDATKRAEYETIQDPGWFRRQVNRVSAAKDAFSERGFKEMFSEIVEGTEGYNYQKNLRQALRKKIDTTIEERGVLEDIDADATSGAMGKMGVMRALGIGDGRKRITKAYRSNAERFLNAFSQFDPSEVIGAVQAISGSGTRGAAYANRSGLLGSVLQAQAAGIGSAGNVGGVFSRSGRGQGMVDLLRSVAGGGTDVSTTSLLGQALAGHADQLNIGQFSGTGALGALAFGTQGSAGAMTARQNIQGMAEQQRLYSGQRDAAQRAQNFLYARQVAPGAGYYAQQYLATKLDAGRVNDILGGDVQLTGEEQALGITPSMLRQQAWRMRNSRNFRTMAKGFAEGSDPAKMMRALQGGESLRDYARKAFAGEDGKWADAEMERAVNVYATTLRAGDENLSLSAALGTARMELFGQGRRARKGKMVGDVAGGSLEAKLVKEEAEKRRTDLDLKDASMDRLEKETEGVGKAYRRLVTNSENLAITADNIADIIKTFSANLRAAAGGRPPATATKVAPK